jgi:hypothetical protein
MCKVDGVPLGGEAWTIKFFYPMDLIDFEALDTGEVWKSNFYSSMYRIALTGALFTRAYTESVFLGGEEI